MPWVALAALLAAAESPAQLFANRLDPASLDRLIAQLSDTPARPRDAEALLLLARAEDFWAQLHADAVLSEVAAHLEAGGAAAREALRLVSPGYGEAVRAGANAVTGLEAVSPAAANALFWAGALQHRLAARRGLAALLVETDGLRQVFARVVELAPDTFHGSAYLHLAELGLALPAGYAASLSATAEELEKAEARGPHLLEVHLVWAERWAVKAQDYGIFKRRMLQLLSQANDSTDSELGPENTLVLQRALKVQKAAPLLFTRGAIKRGESDGGL